MSDENQANISDDTFIEIDGKKYKGKCFVVSPIGNDKSDTREQANDFLDLIVEPICEELNYKPMRIDEKDTAENIFNHIIFEIETSDFIFVDTSKNNPNVFFELGYARAKNKPIIQCCENAPKVSLPFDISQINTFFYDTGFHGKRINEVNEKIIKTIRSDDFQESIKNCKKNIQQPISFIQSFPQNTQYNQVSCPIAEDYKKNKEQDFTTNLAQDVTKVVETVLKEHNADRKFLDAISNMPPDEALIVLARMKNTR